MKTNNKIFPLIFIFVFYFVSFLPFLNQDISAQSEIEVNSPLVVSGWVYEILDGPLIPTECRGKATECGIEEFFQVLVNVFKLMLGLLGSLSLLFFIYGGFVWLFSRGNANMIQKGKDIIIGAVIGMSIVLGSWVIINFVIAVFTGNLGNLGNVTIFENAWWNF
ncbi:MAG: hypothetical protein U9O55_02950 [Patescibacteria group bacterium]|nr:hypothetical protein [Patescibacteria group bacterium]